ncbi:hypothetical protein LDENG_00061570 [Lucifuga dentata]|nr:hypothetical protein LDENG_00061570 [Lucifuga dentata]
MGRPPISFEKFGNKNTHIHIDRIVDFFVIQKVCNCLVFLAATHSPAMNITMNDATFK